MKSQKGEKKDWMINLMNERERAKNWVRYTTTDCEVVMMQLNSSYQPMSGGQPEIKTSLSKGRFVSLNESCFITYVEYTRKLFHLSAFLLTRSATWSGTRNSGVGRVDVYTHTYIIPALFGGSGGNLGMTPASKHQTKTWKCFIFLFL